MKRLRLRNVYFVKQQNRNEYSFYYNVRRRNDRGGKKILSGMLMNNDEHQFIL